MRNDGLGRGVPRPSFSVKTGWTHEMGFARKVGTRVLFMDNGQILEQGLAEDIFDHPQNPRTQDFLSKVIHAI